MTANTMTEKTRLLNYTTTSGADFKRLARALTDAFDPYAELVRYERRLLSAARGRQGTFSAGRDDSLSFALNTLLPVRTRGIMRNLKRSAVEPEAFRGFLSHSLELATRGIEDASDSDDLADVVGAAVDEIHSYVITHDLVADGYLQGEVELARRLLERAAAVAQDEANREPHAETVAADNNRALALAA